ncbi:MAG TPA: DUF3122 domain-containing protein [Nodosilinea sp.]|nr:DUF3122 domain-containing protein [Nodosilinea sp.]
MGVRRGLRVLALALLLGILLMLAIAPPALASVHTYHEQPGQTTYRSRQSLRDQTEGAWQVTVFKRSTPAGETGVYLRLVGFPGRSRVDGQGSLLVQTGTATQWTAPARLDGQTQDLPDNVGQYDFAAVLAELPQPIPLTLVVPVAGAAPARLVVAPYVVQEWLQIYAMTEAAGAEFE